MFSVNYAILFASFLNSIVFHIFCAHVLNTFFGMLLQSFLLLMITVVGLKILLPRSSIFYNLNILFRFVFVLFNCSWTKFKSIIVVCLFYAKFLLNSFDFSSYFNALDFLRFAWSKILSQSQFQAAELKFRQFNTKRQMKSAPKLVQFFTFNLNGCIC